MHNVLITGATGLVGGHLLNLLRRESQVESITAPTRHPLEHAFGISNPHHPDLTEALAQVSTPIDTVFCCLGTTQREAGSKSAFTHVDYDLVLETAQTGLRLGAQQMLVVSAMGANTQSLFFYNRVKGEMEAALIAQGWPRLTLARPSMLLGERGSPRLSERLLGPLFSLLPGNWKSINAEDVAKAMLMTAKNPGTVPVTILTSRQLREMARQ
ncbi:NAD-dependent epimerase/dehydratase family protein [Kluyvera intermedia]|uniref:NAD-dependent epimerase/dehydratase family protein n=1 Tax=Kluyvera intermedia TaxID=61648 RepID=UPI00370C6DE4